MPLTRASNAVTKNGITSATGTYAAKQTDDLIICSGASFTLTLPSAATVPGKVFKILHNGTSLTQVYTLATTSSQTIGGVAGGSYALYTNGEFLEIVSNGSNWAILGHKTDTEWSSTATTVYISSVGNPLTPGTANPNTIRWMRRGRNAIIEVRYIQTVAGTANSGTYGYRIQMPANFQNIDTAITGTNTITGAGDIQNRAIVLSAIGGSSGGATLIGQGVVAIYDTTTFRMVGMWGGTANALGTTLTFASGASAAWNCVAEIPISGWQP
jgi:hypothetical protein